jgi:GNAT superfamily N-acetyltransferase
VFCFERGDILGSFDFYTTMVSEREIAELELLASRCWPAKEIVKYKGWIIHMDDGITWRANSVLPDAWETNVSVDQVVDYIIEMYNERNAAPAFKISPASQPDGLDELLEEKGFEKRMITQVQTAPIEEVSCHSPKHPVDLFKVTKESLDILMYKSERKKKANDVRREIIHRIDGAKNIARVMIHGNIAGVGLGVVVNKWLGFFSIRTLSDYRRRGVAWSVSCALAMWGEDQGAEHAFLQVEADNDSALGLYESMGFKKMYTYWYRILGEFKR